MAMQVMNALTPLKKVPWTIKRKHNLNLAFVPVEDVADSEEEEGFIPSDEPSRNSSDGRRLRTCRSSVVGQDPFRRNSGFQHSRPLEGLSRTPPSRDASRAHVRRSYPCKRSSLDPSSSIFSSQQSQPSPHCTPVALAPGSIDSDFMMTHLASQRSPAPNSFVEPFGFRNEAASPSSLCGNASSEVNGSRYTKTPPWQQHVLRKSHESIYNRSRLQQPILQRRDSYSSSGTQHGHFSVSLAPRPAHQRLSPPCGLGQQRHPTSLNLQRPDQSSPHQRYNSRQVQSSFPQHGEYQCDPTSNVTIQHESCHQRCLHLPQSSLQGIENRHFFTAIPSQPNHSFYSQEQESLHRQGSAQHAQRTQYHQFRVVPAPPADEMISRGATQSQSPRCGPFGCCQPTYISSNDDRERCSQRLLHLQPPPAPVQVPSIKCQYPRDHAAYQSRGNICDWPPPCQPSVFQSSLSFKDTPSRSHIIPPPPPPPMMPPPPPPTPFRDAHKRGRAQDLNFEYKRTRVEANFYCNVCDKSFFSKERYSQHVDEDHIKCDQEGCKFSAPPHVLEAHTLRHVRSKNGALLFDDPAEVELWIQSRKRNFPTKQNIEKKELSTQKGEKLGSATASDASAPKPFKCSAMEKLLRSRYRTALGRSFSKPNSSSAFLPTMRSILRRQKTVKITDSRNARPFDPRKKGKGIHEFSNADLQKPFPICDHFLKFRTCKWDPCHHSHDLGAYRRWKYQRNLRGLDIPMRPPLIYQLLIPDIQKAESLILQAFRYVTQKNFFRSDRDLDATTNLESTPCKQLPLALDLQNISEFTKQKIAPIDISDDDNNDEHSTDESTQSSSDESQMDEDRGIVTTSNLDSANINDARGLQQTIEGAEEAQTSSPSHQHVFPLNASKSQNGNICKGKNSRTAATSTSVKSATPANSSSSRRRRQFTPLTLTYKIS